VGNTTSRKDTEVLGVGAHVTDGCDHPTPLHQGRFIEQEKRYNNLYFFGAIQLTSQAKEAV
jgi:hypothetical protein